MTTANTVYSGPADNVKPIRQERKINSGVTAYPGYIVTENTSGVWILHAQEGKGANWRILDMNIEEQKGATTVLTAGQSAGAFWPVPGQTYNIVVADGETVTIGSPLTSNADGTFKVATTTGATPDVVLMYAEEAASPSGSTARVRARVATSGYPATA